MNDQTTGTIEDMLRDVREALQMNVAFVSKFDADQLVFRKLEGDSESFGWREGESFPIDESYCKRVLDGAYRRWSQTPGARRLPRTCG
jgi:hypothetical protein